MKKKKCKIPLTTHNMASKIHKCNKKNGKRINIEDKNVKTRWMDNRKRIKRCEKINEKKKKMEEKRR